jgi:transposase InsO family protein
LLKNLFNLKEKPITQDQYVIRRKLNILELGETLGNISKACLKLGVSRQHHYDIKSAVEEDGVEGLLEKFRKVPRIGNRVALEIDQKVLDYSLEFSIQVLKRSLMNSRNAENEGILIETQVQALEQAKEEKEVHGEIETPHPGFLLGQDICYIGHIKGVEKICQQTAIDTHSNVGFAKVYPDKTALTAADFLNNKVLPFFVSKNMALLHILTDRGTEYCGRIETQPYQLFLHLNGVEHSRTKVRHPQTNGSTERLNQIFQNEFYKVAFRKKIYKTIEEIQIVLDTFQDGRPLYQQYVFENSEEGKTAA